MLNSVALQRAAWPDGGASVGLLNAMPGIDCRDGPQVCSRTQRVQVWSGQGRGAAGIMVSDRGQENVTAEGQGQRPPGTFVKDAFTPGVFPRDKYRLDLVKLHYFTLVVIPGKHKLI